MKRCKGLFIGLILITIFTLLYGCKPAESTYFATYIEPNKVTVSNVTYQIQENIVIHVYVENKKVITIRKDEIDSFENIEINLTDYLPKEDFENKDISVKIRETVSRDCLSVAIIFATIGSSAITAFYTLLYITKKEEKINKNWG